MIHKNLPEIEPAAEIVIRPFSPADMNAVDDLQRAYAQANPGVKTIPAGYYLSPVFHHGQDVFCAFSGGRLAAYAPCYVQVNEGPANLPHRVWVEIKAHPALANPIPVKDRLLHCLLQRARQRVDEENLRGGQRAAQMVFEYLSSETGSVDYVTSRGFTYSESVFAMSRDLAQEPLPPAAALPPSIRLRRWKMESEAEQSAYLAARNQCFPESPVHLAEWQYFMGSPLWPGATMVAAFAGETLAGCVSVFWNEEDNQRSGVRAGFTEDIFVLSGWRGHGIAYAMVADGLAYLKERGLTEARLMVRALNESALGLYRRLGFQVCAESRFYILHM